MRVQLVSGSKSRKVLCRFLNTLDIVKVRKGSVYISLHVVLVSLDRRSGGGGVGRGGGGGEAETAKEGGEGRGGRSGVGRRGKKSRRKMMRGRRKERNWKEYCINALVLRGAVWQGIDDIILCNGIQSMTLPERTGRYRCGWSYLEKCYFLTLFYNCLHSVASFQLSVQRDIQELLESSVMPLESHLRGRHLVSQHV